MHLQEALRVIEYDYHRPSLPRHTCILRKPWVSIDLTRNFTECIRLTPCKPTSYGIRSWSWSYVKGPRIVSFPIYATWTRRCQTLSHFPSWILNKLEKGLGRFTMYFPQRITDRREKQCVIPTGCLDDRLKQDAMAHLF